jgi:hypothetical protein
MSGLRRPTVPGGFDAQQSVRRTEGPASTGSPGPSDDQPPSGILLRLEVLAGVPRLVVSMSQLKAMPLDDRAGFILSFVDGVYTVEMILDASAMRREEALAILGELFARGVIVVDQEPSGVAR